MSWNPTHIQVAVQRARSLISKGKSGTNDVYATIGLGKEKYHTTLKEKATDPEWYEECDLILPEKYEDTHIEIVVLHRNALGMDEFLGRIELPLRNYSIHDPPRSQWYALQPKPGHTKNFKRGELEVRLCYIVGKVKDPDSISTASSASKRLKIGKKMLSALGDRLHVKKKEKTKDHIPDLTGLDEGVLDDEDIAENYSISIKVPSKRSDTHSHHDGSPPSNAQPSTFTKFTPFPKEKTDTTRSPSPSIVSEEDPAHKHGDAGSDHSSEIGYDKAGRGPLRSSGGKPKKVSLGKRGLISKDKSQSVWEISNTKSEFGLASGLKMTVGASKEDGDTSSNKRPPNSAAKDQGDLPEPLKKIEDSDLANRVKPGIAAVAANSVSTAGLAAVDPSKGSAMGHETFILQNNAKAGVQKTEVKQKPVLVDDDDDDLNDVVSSPSNVASTARAPGVGLQKPAGAGDVDRAKPDTGRSSGADAAPLQVASSSSPKKAAVDVGALAFGVGVDRPPAASLVSKEGGSVAIARAAVAAAGAADVQPGNPFLSSLHEAKPKRPNDLGHGGKEAGLPGKQQGFNPFEDDIEVKPPPSRSIPVNPFGDEEDSNDMAAGAKAKDHSLLPPRAEVPSKPYLNASAIVQQQKEPEVKAKVSSAPPSNPFEESIDDASSKKPAASQPLHTSSLDPPTVETVTIPVVDSSMLKTLVIEPSFNDAKVSRKVQASVQQQRVQLKEPAGHQQAAAASAPAAATASAVTALRSALTSVAPPPDELPPFSAATQLSLKAGNGAAQATSSASTSTKAGNILPKKESSNPFEEDDDVATEPNVSIPVISKPALHDSEAVKVDTQPASSAPNLVGSAGVTPFVSSFSKSKKAQAPPLPSASASAAQAIQSSAGNLTVAVSAALSTSAVPITATVSSFASLPTTSASSSSAALPAMDIKVATLSPKAVVQTSLTNAATQQKHLTSASAIEALSSDVKNQPYERSITSLANTNDSLDPRSKIRLSAGGTSTVESEQPAAGTKHTDTVTIVGGASVEMKKKPVIGDLTATQAPPVSSSYDLARSGKGSSSKGSMPNAVVGGHSQISDVTFKEESTSSLAVPPPTTDSATQTFDNVDNIPQEYRGLSKEVLVAMVLKMKSQLTAKEEQVRDLEEYIDRLLLRVMDGNPALLLHPDSSASNRSGKR